MSLCIILSAPALSAFSGAVSGADAAAWNRADPHRNKAGFFDIHVCNWPGRPLFFMPLFSTTRYRDVEKMVVFYPDGKPMGELDMSRFMSIRRKGKPDKRVYIKHFDVPAKANDGWYEMQIRLHDGSTLKASDYVALIALPRARGLEPGGQEEVPMLTALKWRPVKGARYYQVFLRDLWDEGRLIHESKLVNEPRLALPDGLLEPGGLYSWQVHARDINEHPVLGDFNHGSMSEVAVFSVMN